MKQQRGFGVALEAEQTLRHIVQPAILLDANGIIEFVNDAYFRLISHAPSKLLGRNLLDFLDEPNAMSLSGFIERANAARYDVDDMKLDFDFRAFGSSLPVTIHPTMDLRSGTRRFLCLGNPPKDVDIDDYNDLQNRELRWRVALESAGHAAWDTAGTESHFVSENWYTMRGIPRNAGSSNAANTWISEVHPDDAKMLDAVFERQNRGETNEINYQYRQRHYDGHWMWVLSKGRIVSRDRYGQPHRLIGIDIDISEIKKIEAESREMAMRLQVTVDASGIGLWDFDPETGDISWNANMFRIYGIDDKGQRIFYSDWRQLIHPEDANEIDRQLQMALEKEDDFRMDYRILREDGTLHYIRSSAKYVRDEATGRRGLLGVDIDITSDVLHAQELEQARAKMEYESRHDALTGLGNRRLLDETFAAFAAESGQDRPHSVLHLDLDLFKRINDSLGHIAGDAVLQRVARVTQDVVGGKGLVARVGGDEFVVFIAQPITHKALQKMAGAIVKHASEPFEFDGQSCEIGVSIGVCTYDRLHENPTRIFSDADVALYEAKDAGRNRVVFFCEHMRKTGEDRE